MMRLRRVSVIASLLLLTSAAVAHAECTWVLWFSRSVAMKITGHKTEAVYRCYAIVSEQDLHEAAVKLATAEQGRVIALGQVLGQVAAAAR